MMTTARERYEASPKGRARHARYNASAKGLARTARYEASPKRRAAKAERSRERWATDSEYRERRRRQQNKRRLDSRIVEKEMQLEDMAIVFSPPRAIQPSSVGLIF